MRRVIRYQTSDGALHESEGTARRHADDRYGTALTDLARKAVQVQKYAAMLCFIEENLDTFAALLDLRADTSLEPDTREEE
jgi:F0F1-type ATP synthase delta subunit